MIGATVELRNLFLDFGGTLVASLQDPFPVYHSVLASQGIPIERGRFVAAWQRLPVENAPTAHSFLGRTDEYWRGWDHRALGELGVSDPSGTIADLLRDEFVNPRWHTPFPESGAVLRGLIDRGYRLHVVSNNTEDLRRIVENLGWTDLFSSITFSQEVGAEKPDPRVFRLALERSGTSPAEVIHVGDSWGADIEGARAVGIRPVWVNRDKLPVPGTVTSISDLRELPRILAKGVTLL